MVVEAPRSDVRKRAASFHVALPPYIGGKRRICPLIFREIDAVIPRRHWPGLRFLDAFMGGGSVSLYAKAQGFHVVSCDIAQRSLIIARSLVANSRIKLRFEDIAAVALDTKHEAGPIETAYVPKTFTREQARLLDRIMWEAARSKDAVRGDLLRMLSIRIMLMTHPMARPRSGTIDRLADGQYESITPSCIKQYVDGLRLTTSKRLWEIAQDINAGVFNGLGEACPGDSFQTLREEPADVVYMDPPYPGTQSYEGYYYVLDEVFEGKKKGKNRMSDVDGVEMVHDLISIAQRFPVWILSMGNALIQGKDLEALASEGGRSATAIEIPYVHSANLRSEEAQADNREIVLVSWNPVEVERLLEARSS